MECRKWSAAERRHYLQQRSTLNSPPSTSAKRSTLHSPLSTSSGFTLIELLVVVAIIALLVSILLPSLNRARESAKMLLCQTRIRSIGLAMHMYLFDNTDHYPHGVMYTNGPPFVPHCWEDTLNIYLDLPTSNCNDTLDATIWHCPVIRQMGGAGFTSPGVFTTNPNLMAELNNGKYWSESFGNMLWTGLGDAPRYVRESQVKESPSRNAAWMDSCDPTFSWYVDNNIKGGFGTQNQQTTPHFGKNLIYQRDDVLGIIRNDNVASNGLGTAVFRDGHAEARKAVDWVGSDSVGVAPYSNNLSYNTK